MRMQYDIFVCIRGCAVKEMWLHIYIYRRIIHILEYESIECVPKMGEFLHKKITSHSYDAFKRIDDLARQNSRCWHSNGSPFSFSLFHFLSFSHFESCRGKKNFFQKCVLSFILMACIRIRFIHINKFYQPTKNIYVYNNTYIVFFSRFNFPFLIFISSIFSPPSAKMELTFTQLTSPFCVVVLAHTHTLHTSLPQTMCNFPNAWLWILLILSEQVHQFAIYIQR